jgi:hypothetical protein
MSTDIEWLQQQLNRYAYKPSWVWRLDEGTPSLWNARFYVCIEFSAMDAWNPPKVIQLKSVVPVPPWIPECRDPIMFKRWFQTAIFETELHESREWLRLDGQLVDDPHKDDRKLFPLS